MPVLNIFDQCSSGTLRASKGRRDRDRGDSFSPLSREARSPEADKGGIASERERFAKGDEQFARTLVLADGLCDTDDLSSVRWQPPENRRR
jgi:hypothetical protein